MEHIYRIFDFNVYNDKKSSSELSDSDDDSNKFKDTTSFIIQMFGVNEIGKTCSILIEDFRPFFYVMVNDSWTIQVKDVFLADIKSKMGKYYDNSITECIIIKRKKLYGFDGGKEHKFIKLEFNSLSAFNKAKNLWYSDYNTGHTLLKDGYNFYNTNTRLYEANIPPLLRFFHIKDISPSGWVALPKKKTVCFTNENVKKTKCDFEYSIGYKDVIALNNMETRVPYKIMSFDIEASSSHGDFPVPVKSYKKLTTNIIEYFEDLSLDTDLTTELCKNTLKEIIFVAFGYKSENNNINEKIDLVYPKQAPKKQADVEKLFQKWITTQVRSNELDSEIKNVTTIESLFEKMGQNEENDEEDYGSNYTKYVKQSNNKKLTVLDILCDKKMERDTKVLEINNSLNSVFPRLEGDKVTFIGSTFMRYGEKEPYFNHCIALNTCEKVENSIIESYSTEKEVLLAWQQLVQRENPDIVIGYNIFGFDYEFMFRRAQENNCVEDFMKLSRNKEEVCATIDKETGDYVIEESSIHIASGQHDLKFIKMNGRLQVDLYNFFRREENLTSYKLDYVAGHFIGDYIKKLEHNLDAGETEITTTNMTGLLEGSFIHFEEVGHSIDYYDGGNKFLVTYVDKLSCKFRINKIVNPDQQKKVRWCLAKDDVTPKDIFRMTNGSAYDRSVIAKYCIQDCNLVHYLFNKADILTGFIEMSKICSVPINFLVMRGQGIKLTSFIAKKCREKRTLMPVIEKGGLDEGYEGAIVLDPKCDLYLDNPVACVDYASLYPSSMISENLSHDSKVWSKEYDLAGNLIEECGDKNENGDFIYDNLPGYEYVNITYDTYRYIRKTPASTAEKVRSGMKTCRFAQPGESGEDKAIMPSILEELLVARKTTRKLIPLETDEFMKNVLDKRQLGYKVTANSLYGQCGAKTSTFYEQDIAACTTAIGRLLLIYAKKIIEKCYGDSICNTQHYGKVKTNAEYIYGDTDSVFFTFNLQTPDGQPIRGKKALEITIELAQEAGHLASGFLKGPHDLEYEKTFMPFCLLSKKRYVGMLYETDPNKCKRKEMGIVLKRRDNAPIVKDIYGGIIDILMKHQNIKQATDFLKSCLQNIVDEKYPMDKLIITKSLRSGYKNPKSIAHKVLADRITSRDPGNKPSSGDRIPFVYINSTNKKALQGEKIETPTYILENKLKIDYSFYITNQIMKPVQQVFALVLEKIWESQNKKPKIAKFRKDVETLRNTVEDDKFEDKLEQLKNKEVKALLFDEYLRVTNNEKEGNQSLTKFFTNTPLKIHL
jgi:DNA polymerase elongation subunit (family B)